MSDPDEDLISDMERIGRMAMGTINIEEYEALLFRSGAMLAVFRAAMTHAGYSQRFIECSAWMIMTSFFGHHLTTTEIDFASQAHPNEAPSTESTNDGAVRPADPGQAGPAASA
jgi:hypothetical protein